MTRARESPIARGWRRGFSPASPVGYSCRIELPDRWLRIHSLPDSKRYPDTEGERRELLLRHNEVATAVLGEDARCVLFLGRWRGTEGLDPAFGSLDLPPEAFREVAELATPEDDDAVVNGFGFVAAEVIWRSGTFDRLILAVADELVDGKVVFANTRARTAYAPYDGGADLVLRTPEDVALSDERWRAWRSAHPLGL